MSTLSKIALALGALAAAFLSGRMTATPKVETKIQVQRVVEKQVVTHVVTKVVERPDGTKETVIDENTETNTDSHTNRDSSTIVIRSANLSLLAGAQPKLFDGVSLGPVIFGAHYQVPLIGPATIGIWALTSPAVGVSVGWNY